MHVVPLWFWTQIKNSSFPIPFILRSNLRWLKTVFWKWKNEFGDPNFLFHETLSLCIGNYLGEFKKIFSSEKNFIKDNHVYLILNISTRGNFFKLTQIISYTKRKSLMK